MAASAVGGNTKSMPQTRLKMAFPLGSGGRPNATAGSGGGVAEVVETARPQVEQKTSPSDKLLPQPLQNELIPYRFGDSAQGRKAASARA